MCQLVGTVQRLYRSGRHGGSVLSYHLKLILEECVALLDSVIERMMKPKSKAREILFLDT